MKRFMEHLGGGDNVSGNKTVITNSAKGNRSVVVQSGGGSVSINNGVVRINGKRVDMPDTPDLEITLEGNVSKLEIDCCDTLTVNGDCDTVKTASGDVVVTGGIKGSVKTMSGDVICRKGNIEGSVTTMSGDIRGVRK